MASGVEGGEMISEDIGTGGSPMFSVRGGVGMGS